MDGIGLTELFMSQADLTGKDARWFAERDIPVESLTQTLAGGLLPLKKGRIIEAAECFDFRSDGMLSYLFLALDREFLPIDIVSWGTLGVRSYLGRTIVLGEDALDEARIGSPALDVFLTPLEWLQAGRLGLLVISPERCRDILISAQPLRARSMEHAAELIRLMTRKMEVTW